MSKPNQIKSPERRASITKLASVAGAAAVAGLSNKTWVKPTVNAVMLPAHAQTSACVNGENLTLEITSNDLSEIGLELYSLGGGSSLLLEILPGDLSGSGTRIVYEECLTQDGCYETVLREGEGSATLSQGTLSETRDFPPVPTNLTVGTTCA